MMFRPLSKSYSLLILPLCLTIITSCKKGEEKKETPLSPDTEIREALPAQTSSSASPLYQSLPADTAAFFNVQFDGPAFERLLASKWGKSYLAKTGAIANQIPELHEALLEAGIDTDHPEKLKDQVSEMAVMVFPTIQGKGQSKGQSTGQGGVILRTKSEAKAKELATALAAAAKKRAGEGVMASATAGDFSIPVSFTSAKSADGLAQVQKVVLSGRTVGDRIILALDSQLLDKLSANGNSFRPNELEKVTFSASSETIGIGYVDFTKIEKGEADAKESPVKSGIFTAQMTDHPSVQLKLLKTNESEALSAQPTAPMLLSSMPANPLMYAVFEAGELRKFAAQASSEAQEVLQDSQFSFTKTISQAAVGARVSENAQAMMPIPEFVLSLQTSDAKGVMDAMFKYASGAVKGYGLPGQVTEKQIAGKNVKVLPGAFGVALYAVALDGTVVATTTEDLMKSAIQKVGSKELAAGVSTVAANQLSQPALAKAYLSFPELAKLLRAAAPMAGMATDPEGKPSPLADALSDENLKGIEDMGTVLTTLRSDNESYLVDLSYN
jgi:hypothetical protein